MSPPRVGLVTVLALVACDPDVDADIAAVPPGCVPSRAEDDRLDDHAYDQIRVLYVTTSDGPDREHDIDGRICNSVRAFASCFHSQSGSYLRFDTMDGLLDIGFVRLSKTDAEMHGTDPTNATIEAGFAFVSNRIERELRTLEHNKLYAVYYEGTSSYACGSGAWPPLVTGRTGAIFLRAMPPGLSVPCGAARAWGRADLVPDYVDYSVLHEIVHTLGFVRPTAPHHHGLGHVFDVASASPASDLMYTPRAGMSDPDWKVDDPDGLILDIGSDDYFNANPRDLATSSLLAPLAEDAHRPPGW